MTYRSGLGDSRKIITSEKDSGNALGTAGNTGGK